MNSVSRFHFFHHNRDNERRNIGIVPSCDVCHVPSVKKEKILTLRILQPYSKILLVGDALFLWGMMSPSQSLLLVIVSCFLSLVDVGFLVIPCVSFVLFIVVRLCILALAIGISKLSGLLSSLHA